MLDTSFFLLPELFEYLNGGQEPRRRGNSHAAGTPLNTYRTRDGYVTVAVATDKNWHCLLASLAREDLKTDARFATPLSRREHIQVIDDMVAAWLAQRTTTEAVALLRQHEVPAGPGHTLPELLTHPHLQARQMVLDLEHPITGPIPGAKGFGMPIRFVEHPVQFDQPAPLLGAHNEEIYGTLLGISAAALGELRAKGVI